MRAEDDLGRDQLRGVDGQKRGGGQADGAAAPDQQRGQHERQHGAADPFQADGHCRTGQQPGPHAWLGVGVAQVGGEPAGSDEPAGCLVELDAQ